ncbi:hypothetical protein CVU37_11620 [candidate division BRC1 bacterium HGW-BRC1-1]|jgi:hypothetical protein|nr:MAG: hypothetical protein CVU37_11620 [candidate division BRC1 bacterium HGW-BRC1-1]
MKAESVTKHARRNLRWLAGASVFLVCLILAGGLRTAQADHALDANGLALFNVTVVTPENSSTGGNAVRVLYRSDSFSYDYGFDRYRLLDGRQGYHQIADMERTSATLAGKRSAREYMERRRWHLHVSPGIPVILIPTPTPIPEPTPTPEPTPGPDQVAPAHLPLAQRLIRQTEIFARERKDLVDKTRYGMGGETMTEEQGRQERLRLLRLQRGILTSFFTVDDSYVSASLSALDKLTSTVENKGRFDFEY